MQDERRLLRHDALLGRLLLRRLLLRQGDGLLRKLPVLQDADLRDGRLLGRLLLRSESALLELHPMLRDAHLRPGRLLRIERTR